jgi:hypothetical protein
VNEKFFPRARALVSNSNSNTDSDAGGPESFNSVTLTLKVLHRDIRQFTFLLRQPKFTSSFAHCLVGGDEKHENEEEEKKVQEINVNCLVEVG